MCDAAVMEEGESLRVIMTAVGLEQGSKRSMLKSATQGSQATGLWQVRLQQQQRQQQQTTAVIVATVTLYDMHNCSKVTPTVATSRAVLSRALSRRWALNRASDASLLVSNTPICCRRHRQAAVRVWSEGSLRGAWVLNSAEQP
jgi:hypothetical protein